MRRVSLILIVDISIAIYSNLTVELHAVVHDSFMGCTTDRGNLSHTTDLGVVTYPCIAASADPTYSGRPSCSTCHIEVWHQWRLHIRDGPVLAVEDLSSPRDEYIRWYWDITRVYIGNPANRDTHTVRYQPARVDRRMMEVDGMALGVIQGPPSSPSQIVSFAKKVQTIIGRCMVFIGGTLGCTPSQHDIQQTFLV
ncbi:hypothetical protein M9H77_31578 [Catharanthus roseus]|uniref:Uncharacterized protein n=1 Tax=Catharanthus roseus TaxID=4058 RepID=A0ACC0A4D6_CATRO|nr:hypothetical protein M9H77_31578 [Catharanthus roseus]